jgi:hypothetical protein
MRVPDDVLECVCFLNSHFASAPAGEQYSVGTAFFLAVPMESSAPVEPGMQRGFLYLVTAKHCVWHESYGLADEISVRVNLKAGGIAKLATEPAQWMLHPTADVAVCAVNIESLAGVAFRAWGATGLALEDFRNERSIGAGDDVFVTGLLVHHPGRSKIMPIARVGNIAALPADPVKLDTGSDVVGLLEARSIGGLSGSPVFLHLSHFRDVPDGNILIGPPGGVKAGSGGESRLLGVMHGFYPVGQNDPDGVSGGDENLNTGIAVVALVDRVMDLVNSPSELARRSQASD